MSTQNESEAIANLACRWAEGHLVGLQRMHHSRYPQEPSTLLSTFRELETPYPWVLKCILDPLFQIGVRNNARVADDIPINEIRNGLHSPLLC